MPSWRGSECGHKKIQNSIMPENYEEFISLTVRIRNSKKPSRMLSRNWKHRWLLLCLARQARKVSMARPVAEPMSSDQNLRVLYRNRTNLDVMQEKRINDYWNIDGSRDLSDYWTHTVYCIRREFARRMYVVREKTHKTTGNIQTRLFLTRTLNEIGKKCLVKGEAKMVKWKIEIR